jgi:uncharacterized protein YdcH (DUF465 family)
VTHTPHELHEEFPQQADRIHRLKSENAHFARLSDEYHEVNRAVHRAETEVDTISDDELNELRKRRVMLKDEIAGILNQRG